MPSLVNHFIIQLHLAAIELHQVCKEKLEARKWGVLLWAEDLQTGHATEGRVCEYDLCLGSESV